LDEGQQRTRVPFKARFIIPADAASKRAAAFFLHRKIAARFVKFCELTPNWAWKTARSENRSLNCFSNWSKLLHLL
jgi:hypothetical protein